MLFTRLQVTNFGPLRGSHRIEVRPLDRTRPIVLFGGKNGAGKTTLLEAVRLCLYGRRALGPRPTQAAYQKYLAKKIYRGAPHARRARRAAVGLEFEHSHAGTRSIYHVERGWELRGERVAEDLLITCDGQPLRELDAAHWQDFIDNLIPPALAQLFFFDGERIQTLAEDDDDDGELASSIRALLGLDIVEQLQTDLAVYLGRQARDSTDALQARLASALAEEQRCQQQMDRLQQDAAQLRAQLDRQRLLIRRHEDRFTREGGAFAQQRTALEAERDQLERERQEVEEALRGLCAGLLPFAVVPELCNQVITTLEREDQVQRAAAVRDAMADALTHLECSLEDPAVWDLATPRLSPTIVRNTVLPRIQSMLRATLGPQKNGPSMPSLIHRLAPVDSARVVALLHQALTETTATACRLGDHLAAIEARRRRVEENLRRAPADEQVRPLLDALSGLHTELASLEQQLAAVEAQLKAVGLAAQQARRDRERLQADIRRRDEHSRRLQLVVSVQAVLEDFHAALSRARLTELEHTVARCFNQLARKDDLIGRIAIAPDTFRVTLFNRHDQPISKTLLSAGEKQIYAIALLWALAQVSGRKLPVIIDTPLGRLDSDHRQNLVAAYFPYAAEQVVILSTDSEIDEALAQHLTPAVSRYYRLEYDAEQQASHIVDGYFWAAVGPDATPTGSGVTRLEENELDDVTNGAAEQWAAATLESAPASA